MKLVWFLIIVFVQKSLQKEEGAIPVGVTRRSSGDIVFFDKKDAYSSAIITIESMSPVAIALTADPSMSSSVIAPIKTAGADRDAIFHFKEASQAISSSLCQISSLEVYRGREQVIKISHEGFLLNGSGSIEIYYSEGTYTREEYSGELYRMNLSCSDGGLPESGCLFFKVGGRSNISEAKFNGSVPGTLPTSTSECPPTTTLRSVSDIPNFQSYNSVWFALLLGVGIILIIILSVVCVVVEFQKRRQPQSRTTAIQPQNQGAVTAVQPEVQRNPGPTETPQGAIVPDYHSENPAYNIDAQQRPHEEPMYEVIPLDTDTDRSTPHTVQGAQNVHCDQNPAYVHVLGIHTEERLPTDQLPQCDYSQNPAYGIHSSPNN